MSAATRQARAGRTQRPRRQHRRGARRPRSAPSCTRTTSSRSSSRSSARASSTGSRTTSGRSPHAVEVADRLAEELPGETVDAGAGEADVALAIRDALATFPADEIVVAVSRDDEESRRRDRLGIGLAGRRAHDRGCSRPLRAGRRPMTPPRTARRGRPRTRICSGASTSACTCSPRSRARPCSTADTPERFLCECSQTSCSRVLELTPSEYRSVRETNRRFLVFPDASHTEPEPRDRRRAARGLLGRREARRGRRGGREPRRRKLRPALASVRGFEQARARKTGIQRCRSHPHSPPTDTKPRAASSTAGRSSGSRAPASSRAGSSTGSSASSPSSSRSAAAARRPTSRARCGRSPSSRSAGRCCSRSRSASPATRCGGSPGPRSDAARRAPIEGFDRVAALASGLVYAAFFVLAIEIVLDADGGEDRKPEGDHRRRSRLARRPAPGRVGGPRLRRRRRLPGLPGRHPRRSSTTRRPRRCGPR